MLSPGWTKYDQTCLYDTRDITPLLRQGQNAVGLLLGNGMYNVPAAATPNSKARSARSRPSRKSASNTPMARWRSSAPIINWHVAPGPITFSSIYGGEDFDARLVPAGWDGRVLTIRMAAGAGGHRPGRRTPRAFLRRAADSRV